MTADQMTGWRSFHEQVWSARAQYMRSLIAGGETNPYRVIKLLEARQRRERLVAGGEGGRWEKQP